MGKKKNRLATTKVLLQPAQTEELVNVGASESKHYSDPPATKTSYKRNPITKLHCLGTKH